jgi:glycosyltransferase involved in cell wall biosynthesis
MPDGRIIIVSDYVSGEGAASGGAGHVAYDSYRALRTAGVDVRVVTGFGTAPVGEGDRVHALGGRDLRAGGGIDAARTIYNIEAKHVLGEELREDDGETTIVLLHQWTRYLSPAALGLLGRFRTMIYMHDYFWACPNGAYYDFREARPCDRQPLGLRCLAADCDRNGRVHKAARILRQIAHRASTHAPADRRLFLHLSDRACDTAAPLLPGERHAIVHNPLGMSDAPPPAAAAPRYDFGYFGRLEPEKGLLAPIVVPMRGGRGAGGDAIVPRRRAALALAGDMGADRSGGDGSGREGSGVHARRIGRAGRAVRRWCDLRSRVAGRSRSQAGSASSGPVQRRARLHGLS